MSDYLNAWKNCLRFRGRARRQEYAMFVLVSALITAAACLLDFGLGLRFQFLDIRLFFGPIAGAYALLTLPPYISLTVRRMHDMDRSGAWIPICLVVNILAIVWFFLLIFAQGTPGPNRYGSEP